MRPSRYNLEIALDGAILLVNLLSRAVLELDRDSFEIFKSLRGNEVDEITDPDIATFAQALRSGLFLIDDDFDEFTHLRQRVRHDRYDDQELAVVIAPTMGCNFSYHYCFEDKPVQLQAIKSFCTVLPDGKRFFDAKSFAAVEVDLFRDLRRLRLPMPDMLDASFSVCTAVRENAIVVGPSGHFYKCYFELDQAAKAVGTAAQESYHRCISISGSITRSRETRNALRANSCRSVSVAVRTNGRKARRRDQYARACAITRQISWR
jgi:hypothetical protein